MMILCYNNVIMYNNTYKGVWMGCKGIKNLFGVLFNRLNKKPKPCFFSIPPQHSAFLQYLTPIKSITITIMKKDTIKRASSILMTSLELLMEMR